MAPPSESATPLVVVTQPREPGFFTGTDNVDVEDWIKHYERISTHNRWDPTIMLANLPCCFRGTALTWFETNESTLTSWDDCKAKLLEEFGNPVAHQLRAKSELASRAQTSTEPYVAYIHDVLALCRKVDASMNEQDKVGHVLKGIADDAFHLLICKDCTTVDAILKECRRFEHAKSRRITQQFQRLPNTAATSSCDAPAPQSFSPAPSYRDALEHTVQKIVRRELEATAPAETMPHAVTSPVPAISLIQAVVRDEITNMGFQPVCAVTPALRRSYAPPGPRNVYGPTRYRNPAEWRTPDDRPICFTCRRVGHVARYCRNRWSSRSTFWDDSRRNDGHRPTYYRSQPHLETQLPADAPPESTTSQRRRLSRSPEPRRLSPHHSRRSSPGN